MKIINTILFFIILFSQSLAQNQVKKWYFGGLAALDFMSSPPVAINNSTMGAAEGSASIADENGNILFYTNGNSVKNQLHVSMDNGLSLFGSTSASQSCLIAKKPGSASLFYIFTMDDYNDGLYYSIVDMSLSAGMGSVTVKNASLLPMPVGVYAAEKLTGTVHCNGTDIWVVTHPAYSDSFYAFLLTAAGVNTVPVISTVGEDTLTAFGYLKISPNGKKITHALKGGTNGTCAIYDFNNSSGAVSSSSVVLTGVGYPYGIEYSPDGTKLYASSGFFPNSGPAYIYQWDLCAGNEAAINASKYIVYTDAPNNSGGALQLGTDGKIYKARYGKDSLGIIHNPNALGSACNYQNSGISLNGGISRWGLPNFISSYFKGPHPMFNYSVSCQQVNFSAPTLAGSCAATSESVLSAYWNFGDAGSAQNTATNTLNTSHLYSAPGTYTAQLVLNYPCKSDTLRQVITISTTAPVFSVSASQNTICAGENVVLSASGNYTYNWSIGATGSSLSINPQLSNVYTATATAANGCTSTQTLQLTVNKCLGVSEDAGVLQMVKIFPNPNKGHVTMIFTEDTQITIYNNLGALVAQHQYKTGQHQLDLKHLPNGLYTFEARGITAVSWLKMTKEE